MGRARRREDNNGSENVMEVGGRPPWHRCPKHAYATLCKTKTNEIPPLPCLWPASADLVAKPIPAPEKTRRHDFIIRYDGYHETVRLLLS